MSAPDYNPETWELGYQTSQFGTRADPPPGGTDEPMPYPSVYSALANPPDEMTTAIELPLPTAEE
jgi:hypothetical protein